MGSKIEEPNVEEMLSRVPGLREHSCLIRHLGKL